LTWLTLDYICLVPNGVILAGASGASQLS
jgi:hypothetical protein